MAKTSLGNSYRRTVEALAKARRIEEGIKRMAENARSASDLAKRLKKATQPVSPKR